MSMLDLQQQKSEWKRKGWSIPDLRGGKQEWFQLVTELVQLIGTGTVSDLSLCPHLATVNVNYPWRTYAPFLKGVGLISNRSGTLNLTEIGIKFCQAPSKKDLAGMLHDKYRLFGEVLELMRICPKTVEEIDKDLCIAYHLDWANLSNTRRRMDWFEVLDLIQCIGNRKWSLTNDGLNFLDQLHLVTPEALESYLVETEDNKIEPPPAEIQELLSALEDDPSLHKKRNTYNIWVPSPNRIENLRTIVQFSFERVTRGELFNFIEEEFDLKVSSVESMMPFLKADGLLEEVGKNIYIATSAAKAWCESGNDLDFIRILHSHKRFVGELLVAAKNESVRNDIYSQAKKYGLNSEKTRWIIGFLLEAGLLEETKYLHIKTTPTGLKLAAELPLSETISEDMCEKDSKTASEKTVVYNEVADNGDDKLFDALSASATDPKANGKASGVAFEESIAAVFRYMGFDAKRIGGPGNTDVIDR